MFVASPLQEVRVTNVGGSEWVRSQNRLVLGSIRIGMAA